VKDQGEFELGDGFAGQGVKMCLFYGGPEFGNWVLMRRRLYSILSLAVTLLEAAAGWLLLIKHFLRGLYWGACALGCTRLMDAATKS
jgi:hypothetical protein